MPYRSRRKYTTEFKNRLIEEALQPGATTSGVAKAHDMVEGILRRWVDKYKRTGQVDAPKRYYTDAFKRKTIEDYLKSGMGAAKFGKSRGISDASVRTWVKDPDYNPKLREQTLEATVEPIVKKAKAAAGNGSEEKSTTPPPEEIRGLYSVIGRLFVRIAELDPNFKI